MKGLYILFNGNNALQVHDTRGLVYEYIKLLAYFR